MSETSRYRACEDRRSDFEPARDDPSFRGAPTPSLADFPAELVLDMDPDDLVECCLGAETKLSGAARVEVARPTGNDRLDGRVGLAPDERGGLGPGDPGQRRNLLGYRRREAW